MTLTELIAFRDELAAENPLHRNYELYMDIRQQLANAAVNAMPALIAALKAADAMAEEVQRVGLISSTWLDDYRAARAAVGEV